MSRDVDHPARRRPGAALRAARTGEGMRCLRHSLANLCAGIVAAVAAIVAFVGSAEAARPDDVRATALAIGLALAVCAAAALRASRSDADAARALTGRALRDLP